jgi:hypothetical protein
MAANGEGLPKPGLNFRNVPPEIGELPLTTIYGGSGINQSK